MKFLEKIKGEWEWGIAKIRGKGGFGRRGFWLTLVWLQSEIDV